MKLFYKNPRFANEFQRDVNLFLLHYLATRGVFVYTIMATLIFCCCCLLSRRELPRKLPIFD